MNSVFTSTLWKKVIFKYNKINFNVIKHLSKNNINRVNRHIVCEMPKYLMRSACTQKSAAENSESQVNGAELQMHFSHTAR